MTSSGRHFLQIPGPTNVPERVMRAMHQAVIDHRGPDFSKLGSEVLRAIGTVFQTKGPVVIYPGSGTGAWEAAIVNTLSPGDRVVMFETGHFSQLWRQLALRFGVEVDYLPGDWRSGASPEMLDAVLAVDTARAIKAVLVVHNETSTGVASRLPEIRQVMNARQHPALLMVDAISSLGCVDYRHDEWEIDVSIAGSQKGLMLPPGLSFNAISRKALDASILARLPRGYWNWQDMVKFNADGFFPFTPATTLLYGLREAIQMLHEEGLINVFRRHERHAEATRAAVRVWGLENVCANPAEYSNSLTAVSLPAGHDADRLRQIILRNFDLSLGAGLSKLAGKVFRIGHLGGLNDLMLAGTLGGIEMGLELAGVPHEPGGVTAALRSLAATVEKQAVSR
jgi:alanine-glyoxylate transaminase/serine-glyoxylate transaminase/serine-pyruvate transaminase